MINSILFTVIKNTQTAILPATFLILGCVCIIQPSCQKTDNDNLLSVGTPMNTRIDRGCLVFANQLELDSMIDVTENYQREDILAFQDKYKAAGYISLGAAYQNAKNELRVIQEHENFDAYLEFKTKWAGKVLFENEGYQIHPNINLPFLQNLVNVDGMLKIGDQFVRFYDNAYVIVPENHFDELRNMKTISPDFSHPDMAIFPILRKKLGIKPNPELTERDQLLTGMASTNGSNNGSKRISGEAEVVFWGSSVGLTGTSGCGQNGNGIFYAVTFRDRVYYRIKSEEKKWWGWKDYSSTLTINGSGSVRNTINNTSRTFSLSPPAFVNYSEITLSNAYFAPTTVAICPGTTVANYIFGSGTTINCASLAISVSFGI